MSYEEFEDLDTPDGDSVAFDLLREADMVGLLRPRMTQLASRLGYSFALDVPIGAHSYLDGKTIHISPTSNLDALQAQAGHELGHAGCNLVGVPKRRQEVPAEQIRLGLQVPRWGIYKLARRHGLIPQMFAQFYRHAGSSPAQVIARAAYHSGTPIILHSSVWGRQEINQTCEGEVEFELGAREERKLLAKVRESGQWELGPFGVIAHPWKIGTWKGIAITFDMRRSLSRVVYGYEAAE